MLSIPIPSRLWLSAGLLVLITACGGPGAPSVKLTATPTSLEDGQVVTLNAEVTGAGKMVVEFFKGSEKVGVDDTAPYETALPLTANDDVTLAFSAKATANGLVGTSEAVNVQLKVDKEPPQVEMNASSPKLNSAGSITLMVKASDNKGVVKVEFFKGGNKLGESTTPTDGMYSLNVPLDEGNNGSLKYSAKAYDAKGNVGIAEVNVEVDIDVTNPTISLSADKTTLTSAGNVTLSADALDKAGVTKVEFFKDLDKIGEDTEAPFTLGLSFTAVNNGKHSYSAKAYDAKGNVGTSAEVTVDVDIDITKPSITLSRTPEGNITAAGSITLTATANDDKGIAKVEFYKSGDTNPLSTDADGSDGYKHQLSYTATDNATHSYTAKVTDTSANVAESAPLSVTVDIRGSLSVAISGLPSGTNANVAVTGPDSFSQNLSATATLSDLKPGNYTLTPADVDSGDYSYGAASSTVKVVGESTANGTVSYALNTGALTVSISGLPSGQNVSVTGPNSFSQNISATTTFKKLAAGSYTIAAPDVAEYFKTVTGSPAEVTEGNTASASVSYKVNVVGLWIANNGNNNVIKYNPADLTGSGSIDLSEAKTISGLNGPNGLAFDASGNLWVSNIGPNFAGGTTIVKYNASDLTGSGTATPAKTITGLSDPDGLAFDASGNLWVANYGGNTVLRFNASNLGDSSSAIPAKAITGFDGPAGIAFDASGNLWVANWNNSTLVKFNASDLGGSGSAIPAKTITGLTNPWGLAFDTSGNLWVTNTPNAPSPGRIFKYNASDLSGSGSATPAKTITGLSTPIGLAFDASGNLWVTNAGSNTVLRYNASDLVGSGSATPAMTITGMIAPAGIAFGPTPANLPLNGYKP